MTIRGIDPEADSALLASLRGEEGGPWPPEFGGWIVDDAGYLAHAPSECGVYILGLGVRPDRSRQGLARLLMRRAIDLGVPLSLHVRSGNHAAIALYRSLGFWAVGIEPNCYLNESGLLMVRF